MKNGIATYLDPKLGLSTAGHIWLPLPEQGIPAEWLDLTLPHSDRTLRVALCEERLLSDRCVTAIAVDRAGWDGVERWVADAISRRDEQAKKDAAELLAVAAIATEIDAAIANPGESKLLNISTTGKPWDKWTWSTDGLEMRYTTAFSRQRDRLVLESERRTRLSVGKWAESIAELDDEGLEAFRRSRQNTDEATRALDRETQFRLDALEKTAAEVRERENEAQIRAALAAAPSHALERYESGYLPVDELDRYLEDHAFGSISLPLYVDLTDDDYAHSDECDNPDVRISGRAYDQADDVLDAEEWVSWTSVRDALVAAGFDPQLRRSRVYCRDENCSAEVIRLSARVTAEIGGHKIKRDYAVG